MRAKENNAFICVQCGMKVDPVTNGSYRNHCPQCLYSYHVDNVPGDRSQSCHGLMEPIGKKIHSKKGIQIVHRCQTCHHIQVNKTVNDGNQCDDIDAIITLEWL